MALRYWNSWVPLLALISEKRKKCDRGWRLHFKGHPFLNGAWRRYSNTIKYSLFNQIAICWEVIWPRAQTNKKITQCVKDSAVPTDPKWEKWNEMTFKTPQELFSFHRHPEWLKKWESPLWFSPMIRKKNIFHQYLQKLDWERNSRHWKSKTPI